MGSTAMVQFSHVSQVVVDIELRLGFRVRVAIYDLRDQSISWSVHQLLW